MKWLILFVLFSCTTQKSGEVTPSNESQEISAATESEAKPVSPLTVKPCLCMKMYMPVCANGVNYGNSCEAECNGNKVWKDGLCPTKK